MDLYKKLTNKELVKLKTKLSLNKFVAQVKFNCPLTNFVAYDKQHTRIFTIVGNTFPALFP